MDTIQTSVDDVLPSSKFQIFSGILKASRSADGRMRLHGVASSTTKDLHGDTMEQSALEDMERAANNNLTIFLNHSYEVPEDVAGSVESARMVTRGSDHVGNPNYDLDFAIVVNDANPRAVKAFEAIEKGTKLGLSIGALIPDGGAIREKKSGSYLIQHVELLETSLVGIPANPRSWVEYAAKSLRATEKDATTVPLGSPTLTLDGNTYTIQGTYDGMTINSNSTITTNAANTSFDATVFGEATKTILTQEHPAPEVVDAADACPTCGKGKEGGGDCADGYHSNWKGIEPEVTDAQVTIIQIDTGDGDSSSEPAPVDKPQEGQSTDPDGDYVASGGEAVTASADPVSQVLSLLRTTTGELVTAKGEVAELRVQLSALQSERDTALAERDSVLKGTKEILDQVANSPLVRRTVVDGANRELHTRFGGYLSDDLIKMLEK